MSDPSHKPIKTKTLKPATGRPFTPGDKRILPRWTKGQSGNPAGKSRTRIEFEKSLMECLANNGTPDEAADLVWVAARKGEPWAIQMIYQRLAPQATNVKVQVERTEADGIQWEKLSIEQLEQLRGILEAATIQRPAAIECGAFEAESSPLH